MALQAALTTGELVLCHVAGFVVKYHTISVGEAQRIFGGYGNSNGDGGEGATSPTTRRGRFARLKLQRANRVLSVLYSATSDEVPHFRSTRRALLSPR